MSESQAHISESEHAKLLELLDERRKLERKRKLSKHRDSRRCRTLAQKLDADAPFKSRLAEVNQSIDEIMNRTGGVS